MAIYAVGDIQGCYDPLAKLLDQVNFDTAKDQLWCVGDLVNRGPKSLKVLRLLKSLDDSCTAVLGNHDIHLLAMIYGVRTPRKTDTLKKIINAHDVDELGAWLRTLPLMVQSKKHRSILCHAGIYPWWTRKQALSYSQEIQEEFSRIPSTIKLLRRAYGNTPYKWSDDLKNFQRKRFIINAFTRMRFVSPQQRLNLSLSGYKGLKRKNRNAWFDYPNPDFDDYRIIFGHWSALGFYNKANFLCLDTGYVWDRQMTMVRIPSKATNKKIKANRIYVQDKL